MYARSVRRSILIATLAAGCGGSGFDDPGTRFEPGPCRFGMTRDQLENLDVSCGTLIVPELRSDPDGPVIRLPVAEYALASGSPSPSAEDRAPVVLLTGGPGQSSALLATSIDSGLLIGLQRRVIAFEQRGTALSEPALDCDPDASAADCRASFERRAIRTEGYNTRENARDVCSLIASRGMQVSLRGVSYGSLLAQEVLRTCPELVESAWIDAIVPSDEPWSSDLGGSFQSALDRLFLACGSNERCAAAYPELGSVFVEVLETLPETSTSTESLDAARLLNLLFDAMYHPEVIRLLPGFIYALRDGRVESYFDALRRARVRRSFADGDFSYGMYYAVSCNDDFQYFTRADAELRAAGLHPRIAKHFVDYAASLIDECEKWSRTPKEEKSLVRSDVPTLVTSGGFDPITPADGARRVAKALSRGQFVQFAHLSHGIRSHACTAEMWRDFLAHPEAPVDRSCARDVHLDFFVEP
jgi:pimeloyl-ACP methyl ester carboxylesterase